LAKAPIARTVVMAAVGGIAVLWAVATIVVG
jgi:nitrogen fixation-related uncharacterized protein